jgi:hypothetical protein
MRAWLYDTLVNSVELRTMMGYAEEEMRAQVMPRHSHDTINIKKPFIIYGLGNNTNEDLAEADDHEAHRQFLQIWVHDEGGDFSLIDDILEELKKLLIGASSAPDKVTMVRWLENSQEFNNETYNTIFRYARFQAIISKGRSAA